MRERSLRCLSLSFAGIAASFVLAAPAFAQQPPTLPPPLPPDQPQQPPPQPYQPPQQPQQPQQYQPQPQYQAPPPVTYAPPPPPVLYNEPPKYTHAPKFSLWVGGRLGIIGYGGNFYTNEQACPAGSSQSNCQQPETTGNFVGNGLGLEVDIGARLAKRYIPYVALELAGMPAGHRFEGGNAKASTSFFGIGFRYLGGDVDNVAFASDLSFGVRTVQVTQGSEQYQMKAIEILRLGLGAEIRISTLFTLSPMFTLSGGVMNDTAGSITYSQAGSGDGLTHPRYQNGAQIGDQRGYTVVSLACGAHFDLFGK